ncbi:osmoprotectant ABC transporter substrate-binding protein [Lacticaseibacillus camelliae]|uniref:Periplasmic glycine betaine choline-binding (Lipo)protein of an ABC-type transport system n=1 Tax=Lacticaseibacillus camelliae DSM 22697 = JCM 13995 TaxID=1423730 RepID=A0A0R2F351_9LACO|nr:osmoprotectant ABC transporter substrate-binding protein [Lacticaseibacillus camelliae]KRN22992.1 periplasmic glycine betaine choline-binding (lipo)protein of an ABC-type transport system [Lacticaseibacillus camelliae DSM 22697 = JCM 13995]
MKKFTKLFLVLATAVLTLSGCGFPGIAGTDQDTIKIAALSSTESSVMANMLAELITHELGYPTTLVANLGSTTVTHQAMLRGDADIAATRYTGTDLTGTLKMPVEKNPQKASWIVKRVFKQKYHQTWFPTYGFADTYAFMVTKQFAAQHHVSTISQLQPLAKGMDAGVDSSWMNRKGDGYADFKTGYGFDFKRVYPMQIGLVYDAVEAGKMQTVLGYSTDGRIKSYDLTVLKDNKHFFPPYDASLVVNDSLLKKYPKLAPVLHRLDGKISMKAMQALNYQVDDQLKEPSVVAREFLVKHHYFRGSEH